MSVCTYTYVCMYVCTYVRMYAQRLYMPLYARKFTKMCEYASTQYILNHEPRIICQYAEMIVCSLTET